MKKSLAFRSLFIFILPFLILVLGLTSSLEDTQAEGNNSVYLPLTTSPLPDQWIKHYRSSASSYASYFTDMVLLSNEDILSVGEDTEGQGSNGFITRTTIDGELLWSREFDTDAHEEFHATAEALDSGSWVGGSTVARFASFKYPWLIRLDPNGNVLWEKTYEPDTTYDRGAKINDILPTPDGGALLAIDDSRNSPPWVVKVTGNGDVSWVRSFSGPIYRGDITHIDQTLDGNYILAGTNVSINSDHLVWVMKMAGDGTILWQRIYGYTQVMDFEYNTIFGLETLNDGSFYLGVKTDRPGQPNNSDGIWILRLNANGGVIWQRTINIGDVRRIGAMTATQDQGLVLGGNIFLPSSASRRFVLKVNPNGSFAWNHFISLESIWTLQEMSTGDIIAAGSANFQNQTGFMIGRFTAQGPIEACIIQQPVSITILAEQYFEQGFDAPEVIDSVTVADLNTTSSYVDLEPSRMCP